MDVNHKPSCFSEREFYFKKTVDKEINLRYYKSHRAKTDFLPENKSQKTLKKLLTKKTHRVSMNELRLERAAQNLDK